MDARRGRWGGRLAVVLASVAAGLVGQFLAFIGLYGLGLLSPYVSADNRAAAALALGVGTGSVLGGILFLWAYGSARAAWMLAGLVLIPLGLSMVVTACSYGVLPTPIGTGPASLCEPDITRAGIVTSTLGAGVLAAALIHRRWARIA